MDNSFESLHHDDLRLLGAASSTFCAECTCKNLPYCTHEPSLMTINEAKVQQRALMLLLERISASRKRESK